MLHPATTRRALLVCVHRSLACLHTFEIMDLPASRATAAPASSSSQIHTGECTEALTTGKAPAVSKGTHGGGGRRLRGKGKDPVASVSIGPQHGEGTGTAKDNAEDVPATRGTAAAPASSSSQIDKGKGIEALIPPGPTATGKAPALSKSSRRRARRWAKGKDAIASLSIGPQQGEGTGKDDDEDALAALIKKMDPDVDGFPGMMKKMDAEYRATKDTPERLEKHRARMSFFKGSSDGPDLDPESNPLYSTWEKWANSVQFIHTDDFALGMATPESNNGLRLRRLAIFLYSYAVPSTQVLQYMVKRAPDGRIVELGAGSGYWAHLLQKLGADVVAVDNGLEEFACSYFPACKKVDGAEFLAGGGADGRALFLCWPRMKDDKDTAAAAFLDNFGGDTIFFVGEVSGATFCMLQWLGEHKEQGWVLEETFPIPTWPGLFDKFMCISKVAAAAGHGSGQSTDPCQSPLAVDAE